MAKIKKISISRAHFEEYMHLKKNESLLHATLEMCQEALPEEKLTELLARFDELCEEHEYG